jgi:uncharacterized membrane protein YsdA (DUF1294 family)
MNLIEKILIAYLLLINIATLILYGIDKWKAKHNMWRISEATLLILAAVGGSIGAFAAMKLFHHKTKHKKFYIGVPVIIILQIALFIILPSKCTETMNPIAIRLLNQQLVNKQFTSPAEVVSHMGAYASPGLPNDEMGSGHAHDETFRRGLSQSLQ